MAAKSPSNSSSPDNPNPTVDSPPIIGTDSGPGNQIVVNTSDLVEAGKKLTIPGQTIKAAFTKWRSGLSPLGEPWGGPEDEVGKQFGPNYRKNEAATAEVLTALYEGMFALEGNFNVMTKNFNNAEEHNSR